jgi:hypothetical protein
MINTSKSLRHEISLSLHEYARIKELLIKMTAQAQEEEWSMDRLRSARAPLTEEAKMHTTLIEELTTRLRSFDAD